ncbi:MAG: HIT domain-containing protein [Candidatus Ryanbacteria bacterium]|nr:HIT domain-containing protein [Candidatus Ryanbacteria bacterium]
MVDPTNARTEGYARTLAEIQAAGLCPFCPENFRWHPHSIIFHEDGWRLTPNAHPYENAEYHLLIIPDRHYTGVWNISSQDWKTIRDLVLKAGSRFKFKGGGLTLRYGDTKLSGATVAHLHFHLIVPKIDASTGRALPVYFPIG